MRYTLWSRGRLVGETDLEFIFRVNGLRCGWLHPTEVGDRLMAAATGVPPRSLVMIGPDATARADLLSAVDQEEALELQLRGPSGAVIATESIGIVDTQYLLSLAESDLGHEDTVDREQQGEIDALLEEWNADHDLVDLQLRLEEEPELLRYQIQVRLVNPDSLP